VSFIWPTTRNPDPGAIGRLGRVLHWVGLILGLAIFGLCVAWAADDGPDQYAPLMIAGAVFLAALALAGRGLRYILAAE
jgi:hypothetical protein